jgi:hypothetical protein
MPAKSQRLALVSADATNGARKVFQEECVELFGELVQLFGVPKSIGQIYGLLFASPVALNFSRIVEQLGISKGSVSQGLHLLRSLGAINVVDTPKSKPPEATLAESRVHGVLYVPELSLRKLTNGILQQKMAPLGVTGRTRLVRLREIAERDRQGDNFCLDRVEQMEIWRRRFKTVLPVLGMMLGPKDRRK